MEFGEHKVETHARETDLSVVYTIDPAVVEDYINTVHQLLARDKYKMVGIDLQFVNSTDYKFATVETSNDVKALMVTGLLRKNLVEIHDHYRVRGRTKKDSLVELASAIIDPYYEKMKQDANRTSLVSWHGAWMRQLDEPHLRFAAKSVYTCYEMHRRIIDMRKCLIPKIDEAGSSHKQSSSCKRHKK
ncbi:hypothetical protein VPH35_117319 [Triticum aestivum]